VYIGYYVAAAAADKSRFDTIKTSGAEPRKPLFGWIRLV